MFKRKVNQDKYLYHYTSFNTFLKIIRSLQLRFNFYSLTNDPKEKTQWTASLQENTLDLVRAENDNEKKSEMLEMIVKFNKDKRLFFSDYKEKYQLLCFAKDRDCDQNNSYLYRGFSNPVLWNNYGDKHKGICLILKKDVIDSVFQKIENSTLIGSKSVNYNNEVFEGNPETITFTDIKQLGFETAIGKHFDNSVDYLFFQKSDYWKSEYEYRYVIKNEFHNNVFINVKEALKGIIYGEDIPNDDKLSLEGLCKTNKIPMFNLDWENGYPVAYIESEFNYMQDYEHPE